MVDNAERMEEVDTKTDTKNPALRNDESVHCFDDGRQRIFHSSNDPGAIEANNATPGQRCVTIM
jgi:hypothetical protein